MALLDWRDARHWAPKPAPCGVCEQPTNLRSGRGKPVHKVCAEQWTDTHPAPAESRPAS
ncbi:hypothetical protein LO771_07890 [Streptacidiphilus sp. ASG 303]|uniref:hypothetical protein n=1 Tax=Streptacidiphilus sp. ASG 303 TaxID=2896847 RepID=UPI001E507596|nr:hypothetical protein [Streptacidiphilus sp. ASG 303]MCD0482335.1 hypothetical protein [Streptacidiphilus sp. ASG 303]